MQQKRKKIRMAALITVLSVLILFFCRISSVSDKKNRSDGEPVLSGERIGRMDTERQICI